MLAKTNIPRYSLAALGQVGGGRVVRARTNRFALHIAHATRDHLLRAPLSPASGSHLDPPVSCSSVKSVARALPPPTPALRPLFRPGPLLASSPARRRPLPDFRPASAPATGPVRAASRPVLENAASEGRTVQFEPPRSARGWTYIPRSQSRRGRSATGDINRGQRLHGRLPLCYLLPPPTPEALAVSGPDRRRRPSQPLPSARSPAGAPVPHWCPRRRPPHLPRPVPDPGR